MAVVPIMAVHGAQVPWGKVVVASLTDQARIGFHAAA
jgi:hypothetical protein